MMPSKRQTIEQKRALIAWEHIKAVTEGNIQTKYGTLARKLPAMIQMNGLGTTLAFLLAKGKDEHKLLYSHVSKWVVTYLQIRQSDDFDNLLERVREQETQLLDTVRQENMDTYRRATAEAIEYGIWLKRYVEAKDWGSAEGDNAS